MLACRPIYEEGNLNTELSQQWSSQCSADISKQYSPNFVSLRTIPWRSLTIHLVLSDIAEHYFTITPLVTLLPNLILLDASLCFQPRELLFSSKDVFVGGIRATA